MRLAEVDELLAGLAGVRRTGGGADRDTVGDALAAAWDLQRAAD